MLQVNIYQDAVLYLVNILRVLRQGETDNQIVVSSFRSKWRCWWIIVKFASLRIHECLKNRKEEIFIILECYMHVNLDVVIISASYKSG
ncbi:hypothetical protein DAI22_02g052900 [Oryza sativa Japonica Group]|jgi:hypothetical protein|nr:hypothetical protein DAI22_02g052900 [Oryza sativa Japonica Group]